MFHGPKRKLGRVALVGAVVASVVGSALLVSMGVAGASGGCGTTPADGNLYIACALPSASPQYAAYTDGQQVDLSMGANAVFSPSDANGGAIVSIECEYNSGFGAAGDPPNANFCDAQTAAGGFPETVNSDGSWDYSAANAGDQLGIYALPGSSFQGSSITCDATHACVLYVGESYNDFTQPHVFSNPFFVDTQSISSASSTSDVVGSNENFQVVATGTPTFSDSAFLGCTPSTLPSNVTFNSAGLLSGVAADGSVGTYTVCAVDTAGSAPSAAQAVTFTVTKAPLTITASSASMVGGTSVPHITPSYSPFVNSDTASSLTTAPTCSTTATTTSAPGNYPSTCSGAVDPNYSFTYHAGTVTVTSSFYVTTAQSAFSATGTPGDAYGPVQLTATGGTAPYKWKLTGGSLPKSVKVHPNGVVSGNLKGGKHPVAAGHYTFTVSVSTHKSKKAPPVETTTATFTITVS